eukprot:symbB.v1.2.023961.t1/scaffold2234.1/size87202/5
MRPPCSYCLRLCNGLCRLKAAEAASSLSETSTGLVPKSMDAMPAADVEADVAAANLAANLQKQATRRNHKSLQAQWQPTGRAVQRRPVEALAPASMRQPAVVPRNTHKPRRGRRPNTRVASTREFEAERAMQRVRAAVQKHVATTPALEGESQVPEKPTRPRKSGLQGDKRLAKRLQAEELQLVL